MTETVNGATNPANETPRSAIGPITPNTRETSWPSASQT